MTRWQFLLSAAAVVMLAGPARAVSSETRLTPKMMKANGLAFQVKARDVGLGKEVEVVVRAEKGKTLSPFLEGRLSLYEGKRLVLSCPVQKREQDGALRYRFYVSARDVDKIQFCFNEYAFAKIRDKDGGERVIGMPAVDAYWFPLKDMLGGR